jgi:hypothetical protein
LALPPSRRSLVAGSVKTHLADAIGEACFRKYSWRWFDSAPGTLAFQLPAIFRQFMLHFTDCHLQRTPRH